MPSIVQFCAGIGGALLVLAHAVAASAQAADPFDESNWSVDVEPGTREDDSAPQREAPPEPQPVVVPFSFEERPFALAAVAGLGTFVGELGAVFDITPTAWVSVGMGAGSNFMGPQYGAYVRARPLHWARSRALALATTFSLSTGPYQEVLQGLGSAGGHGEPTGTPGADRALWGQFDLSFELRARSGFMLLAGSGVAYLLASSGEYCWFDGTREPGNCKPHRGHSISTELPTVTVAVGYAFDMGG